MTPPLEFSHSPAAASFAQHLQAYLAEHFDPRYDFLAIGALVFDTSDPSSPRVLLIQRAATDSMPNLWEFPGGGCDTEDRSILFSIARELWEETGLRAKHIYYPVCDAEFFRSTSGKKICKLNFLVQVETNAEGRVEVRLNPSEHQRFVWATEDAVQARRAGEIELKFTNGTLGSTITEAFTKLRMEARI